MLAQIIEALTAGGLENLTKYTPNQRRALLLSRVTQELSMAALTAITHEVDINAFVVEAQRVYISVVKSLDARLHSLEQAAGPTANPPTAPSE